MWNASVGAAALLFLTGYTVGWLRLRRWMPGTASPARLAAALAATLLFWTALAGPLAVLSANHYLARMGQQVAIFLLGAPLLWLALPFHTVAWAAPAPMRRRLAAAFVRPARAAPLLHLLTNPAVVWFAYLSAFLTWHDPAFVAWSMAAPLRRTLAPLLLLVPALLFWQVIVRTGPRRFVRVPPLARFAMLVAIEIPNVVAGITITFRESPLYAYYAALPNAAAYLDGSGFSQQTLGGALTWVFGSLVYIFSTVLVVHEIFHKENIHSPQPPPRWDADEKFIAPGLEQRLTGVGWQPHDWRDN